MGFCFRRRLDVAVVFDDVVVPEDPAEYVRCLFDELV